MQEYVQRSKCTFGCLLSGKKKKFYQVVLYVANRSISFFGFCEFAMPEQPKWKVLEKAGHVKHIASASKVPMVENNAGNQMFLGSYVTAFSCSQL